MARKPHPGWAKPITDFSIEHGAQSVLVRVKGETDDAGTRTARVTISTPGATGHPFRTNDCAGAQGVR